MARPGLCSSLKRVATVTRLWVRCGGAGEQNAAGYRAARGERDASVVKDQIREEDCDGFNGHGWIAAMHTAAFCVGHAPNPSSERSGGATSVANVAGARRTYAGGEIGYARRQRARDGEQFG